METVDVLDAPTDWTSVGLCLALVGSFLLGNAMLIRRPRELVRERFGLRGARLVAIRETMFHRIQVGLGFLYLIGGFALQLVGQLAPPPRADLRGFPVSWVALIAIATVVLVALGWWWSARSFRRTVRSLLLERADVLNSDPRLVREIGDLFGVDSNPEDTVGTYADRVRAAVGVAHVLPDRARAPQIEDDEVTLLEDDDHAGTGAPMPASLRLPPAMPRSRRARNVDGRDENP